MLGWLTLAYLVLGGAAACHADNGPPQARPAAGKKGSEPKDRQPPVKKEDFRFDGKTFEQWRAYLSTELKPERRLEALDALKAFANNGYGKEAAAAALDAVKAYKGDLTDKDREVLAKAGAIFRDLGEDGEPLLLPALGDPNKNVRSFATAGLSFYAKTIPATAVPGLVRAVVDGQDEDKWAAVPALIKIDDIGALLRKELKDQKKAAKFVAALSEILGKRAEAGLALAFAGDKEKGPAALAVFSAPAMAALLLGELGPQAKDAVPRLLECADGLLLLNPLPVAAVDALGKIGTDPERVVPALTRLLKADAESMRGMAARALGRFGPRAKSAAPALREAVADKQFAVGLEAYLALDRLGEDRRQTVPLAVAALGKAKRATRTELYKSLKEYVEVPIERYVPVLVAAFEKLPEDRAAIAAALGRFGPTAAEAIPVLTGAQTDNDAAVRQAAADALRRIRKENK
jgi:HEAT repeat protein